MNYLLRGHDRNNAVHDMLICLLPDEPHTAIDADTGGDICISSLENRPDGTLAARALVRRAGVETDGECVSAQAAGTGAHMNEYYKRAAGYAVKTSLYRALLPHLESAPVWGSLTGVKPAKPVRTAILNGLPQAGAAWFLEREYFVSPSRAELCVKAALAAIKAERQLVPREAQLYVGIPFCPAKCAYCSFVSNDTRTSGELIEPYVDALMHEIRAAGRMSRANSLKIGSLYIGGGTPTVLEAVQLDALLRALHAEFDLSGCREITVEAGRPETIDGERLAVLAAYGVTRVSVNPQTMNDEVLRDVGRMHTAHDIERAYRLVREHGFGVNMDLIAGLPRDDSEGFLRSVRWLIGLRPENITIHSLALKKGAAMRFGARGTLEARTLDDAYELLGEAGYSPYYLYRQKYTAGGLENVGFCLDGQQSHYNICMMEELCDVIALGAGGITKLCAQNGEKIERVGNPKYPREYIAARDAIARRKAELSLIF